MLSNAVDTNRYFFRQFSYLGYKQVVETSKENEQDMSETRSFNLDTYLLEKKMAGG